MSSELKKIDPRIVILGIEIDGELQKFQDLYIKAKGTKYANANQNECEVEIANLDKKTRDYLATATSPFNSNNSPKIFTVEVGRESTGTNLIFKGTIASIKFSQPPDIILTIKALTGNHKKGDIVSKSHGPSTKLSQISASAASDLGLQNSFEATDKNVSNYTYTGGSLNEVDNIGAIGNINCYVDDDSLVTKDQDKPLNTEARVLNDHSGLIGVPELTEKGLKVTYLLDSTSKLGGSLQVESKLNVAANGTYTIYKLGFEIANRDTAFYWIAECTRAKS